MKFKVKFKAKIDGRIVEGVENPGSWFLIDQCGEFYSYAPLQPIRRCSDQYKKLECLIKIGNEWLTIEEIESRIKPENTDEKEE